MRASHKCVVLYGVQYSYCVADLHYLDLIFEYRQGSDFSDVFVNNALESVNTKFNFPSADKKATGKF